MPGWLTLPLLIDLILIGMALEAGWLIWRHRRAGQRATAISSACYVGATAADGSEVGFAKHRLPDRRQCTGPRGDHPFSGSEIERHL